jgi:hypothetical protein
MGSRENFSGFFVLKQKAVTWNISTGICQRSDGNHYGEALLDSGYKEDVIRMYKRSLELNPTSEGGIKAMKKPGRERIIFSD